MSRSLRKTPIFGHTKARSEREDKMIWHQRFRSRERNALAVVARDDNLAEHVTTHFRQVSNPWGMEKDGRSFLSRNRLEDIANYWAQKHGRTQREREAINIRLIKKWMRK